MQLVKQLILKHLEYHDEDKINKRNTISHLAESYCLAIPFINYEDESGKINNLFEDYKETSNMAVFSSMENLMRPAVNDFLHKFEFIKTDEVLKIKFKDDVIGFLKEELGGL